MDAGMDDCREDPRASTLAYMQEHKLQELVEGVIAELLFFKPPEPKKYILSYLQRVKASSIRPLMDEKDLTAMFSMFDLTKRGTITTQQADNALRTLLGSRAAMSAEDAGGPAALDEKQFVEYMRKALLKATPYSTDAPDASDDEA